MAHQLFQKPSHADIYQRYRPPVPAIIVDEIVKFTGACQEFKLPLAVDVGCGSGQMTERLTPYCELVKGFDISEAQIGEAKRTSVANNVEYSVSPAESLPLKLDSVVLVTAASVIHWLDFPRFSEEVDRLLRPGGYLAVSRYEPRIKIHNSNKSIETHANDCITKLIETINPLRKIPFEDTKRFYENFTVPFGDIKRKYYEHRSRLTLTQVINFYRSFSMVQHINDQCPTLDVIGDLQTSLLCALQQEDKDPDNIQLDGTMFYILCLVRKR